LNPEGVLNDDSRVILARDPIELAGDVQIAGKDNENE